jgi:hypothetical protein
MTRRLSRNHEHLAQQHRRPDRDEVASAVRLLEGYAPLRARQALETLATLDSTPHEGNPQLMS